MGRDMGATFAYFPTRPYYHTKCKHSALWGVTTLTNAVSGQSQNLSGNRDTWKFFRETRDNSGTLQKKIGTKIRKSGNFIS